MGNCDCNSSHFSLVIDIFSLLIDLYSYLKSFVIDKILIHSSWDCLNIETNCYIVFFELYLRGMIVNGIGIYQIITLEFVNKVKTVHQAINDTIY